MNEQFTFIQSYNEFVMWDTAYPIGKGASVIFERSYDMFTNPGIMCDHNDFMKQ